MDVDKSSCLNDISDSDVLDLEGEMSDDSDSSDTNKDAPNASDDEDQLSNSGSESLAAEVETEEASKTMEKQASDSASEDGLTNSNNSDGATWKVLGEHLFVQNKTLSSAPAWAENPSTFDAQIVARTGTKLDYLDGLDEQLFECLSKEISIWLPVQQAILPELLRPNEGPQNDVAISAPTGSGKTLCYLIPILNQILRGWKSKKRIMTLVLAPTRVLVRQIAEEFNRFNCAEAKIVVLGNGTSYPAERKMLFPNGSNKAKAHVIIATPQRFVEHFIDRTGTFNFKHLRYLVVDEADAMRFVREEWLGMLERASNYPPMKMMGVVEETNGDYNMGLQKILVSATLSLETDKLYDWNLRSPRLFRATAKKVIEKSEVVQSNGMENGKFRNLPTSDAGRLVLPESLTHEIKICQKQLKPLLIYCYLAKNVEWRKALVFVNSIDTSRRLTILLTYLFESQRRISELSSNVHARRRVKEVKRLSSAENFVVICSDAVGRGIDIPGIDVVFNYDVPQDAKRFVHRAGRTARAGASGHVVTLATKEEKLGFKRNLIGVDIYDSAVENRDNDTAFVKRFEGKYQSALNALKQKLEETPLRKKLASKKNRWKKLR